MENRIDYGMPNIKKPQQVINTIVYSGLLFVMMMQSFLFDGWTHWAGAANFFVDSNMMLQIAFFLSCLATLLEMPINGPRALLAAIMIIIPRVITITHQNFLLTEMVLLASLSNLNTRRQNMYIWMFTHVLYIGLLIWLNNTAQLIPVLTDPKPTFGLETVGSSFGMGHPNSFALFIMSTVMMLWVMLKNHLRWLMTFLLFLFAGAAVFYYTLSRTIVIIMMLFPIVSIIIEVLLKKQLKGIKILISFIPYILLVITLGISLYVAYILKNDIDINFSTRFNEIKYIIAFFHKPFGSFDAINAQWSFFDNLYLMLIACCGYIPTIISLGFCGAMMRYLFRTRDTELLSVTVIFLIYGMMENAVIYSIYFFVPILAFAYHKRKVPESFDILNDISINKTEGSQHGQ